MSRAGWFVPRASAATDVRPSSPGVVRRWLWLALLGSSALAWGLPWLHAGSDIPTALWKVVDRLQPISVQARRVAIGLLAVLTLEIVGGMLVRVLQQRIAHGRTGLHRRVRVPRPVAQPGVRPRVVPDTDLWQALLPALAPTADLLGKRPQAIFTLTGTPNHAATLGYVVSGGTDHERQQTARALDGALHGAAPDAVIDDIPDPLLAARAPGRVLLWVEYALHLPAEYPLRRADAVDVSPLLGPLLQALQPIHGTVTTELQIGVQPLRGTWAGMADRQWRTRARTRLWDLQHHRSTAHTDDIHTLEAKLGDHACRVTLRAAIVATSAQAADGARDRIDGALAGYREGRGYDAQQWRVRCTRIHPWGKDDQADADLVARAHRPSAPPTLFLPSVIWRPAPIVSAGEVGALWHLPTAKLASMIDGLPNRHLPSPAAAFIAPHETDRVVIGEARQQDGTWAPVGPSFHDLCEGLVVTAGMGAYKTRLALNLCRQFLQRGLGFFVGDGKGDSEGGSLVTKIRQQLPLADEARLGLIDPLDVDWPIGFNIFAGVAWDAPGAVSQLLGQVQALLGRIDPEGWQGAHGMRDLLDMATLLVLYGFHATGRTPILADVMQALQDHQFRASLLPHCTNRIVAQFWTARPGELEGGEMLSRDALLRRFKTLLGDDLVRGMVNQAEPPFSFERAIAEQQIVLFPLPHKTLGGLAGALGTVVLQVLTRAVLRRPGDARSRHIWPVVFDEVQTWIAASDNADIETVLTQFREYATPPCFFHQTLEQWKTLLSLVRTNMGCRMLLRCDDPDATTLAREYAAWGLTDADLKAQPPADHQYAVLRVRGQNVGPLSVRPEAWPEPLPVTFGLASAWSALHGDQEGWQYQIPADSSDPQFDHEVCQLVYHPLDRAALDTFARARSDAEWQRYQDRWAVIRDHQRRYLLAHPWLIPDRMERQRWLSRLLAATPRVLLDVADARRWHAMEQAQATSHAAPKAAKKDTKDVPRVASFAVPGVVLDDTDW